MGPGLRGKQTAYVPKLFDARGSTWIRGDDPIYLIVIDGNKTASGPTCLVGGSIIGNWSVDVSWSRFHHIGAVTARKLPSFHTSGMCLHNFGDGIRMEEDCEGWSVRSTYMSFMHDDCIEADFHFNGLVEDCLLDGCFVGISCNSLSPNAGNNGTNNTVTVNNTLIRLQPMKSVYNPAMYPTPGHGSFFKWDVPPPLGGKSPQLSIHNCIFRMDQKPNYNRYLVPSGYNLTCSNNTIIWLGGGPFPYFVPECFTLITDKSVWDRAVAKWKAEHPICLGAYLRSSVSCNC